MSIWTEVRGTFKHRKDEHFSLLTHIKEHADASECTNIVITRTSEDKEHYYEEVKWSMCCDGLYAAEVLQEVVDYVPRHSRIDLTAEIRFVG